MDEIQFSFEITKQDYIEANVLLYAKQKRRRTWIVPLLGVAVLALPFSNIGPEGYMQVDLASSWPIFIVGVFLIYYGVRYQSPRYLAGLSYAGTGIEHRPFKAFVSAEGIRVESNYSEWKYRWQAILLAEESATLFVLYTGLQTFALAKRFMTDEQANAIRQLVAGQPAFPGGTVPRY
jgi:YcxB-like protein